MAGTFDYACMKSLGNPSLKTYQDKPLSQEGKAVLQKINPKQTPDSETGMSRFVEVRWAEGGLCRGLGTACQTVVG